MSLFQHARFVAGAVELAQLPRTSRAEVAFAGRSNAGKSSAINALLNRKKLAFVSKTPGRTQQLNYFDLGDDRYLVDLPGYGYARVSKPEQARWERLLPTYLQTREALRGLVSIMDIRHPITHLDELLIGVFAPTTKPIHALLTKSDKLSRGAAHAALLAVQSKLQSRFPFATCQLFSSLSREGVDEAKAVIEGWLRDGRATQPASE
jgi:GTP-binding protein